MDKAIYVLIGIVVIWLLFLMGLLAWATIQLVSHVTTA